MEKIRRFEDLIIWQESRKFTREIYVHFKELSNFADRALSIQIIRSSASVMDNIAEGFERGGNKEFLQYLWIAKASAGESRSQIYRAFDLGLVNEEIYTNFKKKAELISVGIYRLIQEIKKSEFKGQKYV